MEYPVISELLAWGLPIFIPIVIVALLAIFKDKVVQIFEGIEFRNDKNFNVNETVILEGRKALLTSIGLTKTSVLMLDTKTVRVFRNSDMQKLKMEKVILGLEQ